jgi:hypothetical protein
MQGVLLDWTTYGDILLPVLEIVTDDILNTPSLLSGVSLSWVWADE